MSKELKLPQYGTPGEYTTLGTKTGSPKSHRIPLRQNLEIQWPFSVF